MNKQINEHGQYIVYVDDNFHFMDESERDELGRFETADEAVAKCKEIVDGYLLSNAAKAKDANELLTAYKSYGEDPFVVAHNGKERVDFSAWDYAEIRSKEIMP